ncbi:Calvin cycle protein CP12 [Calothrix sp. NIES-3974]|uniref:Calvin cycle protein CP12 n=1 Tax=Calothrix sp. NIES-3974 TaxID=2005462 RepID=UPI000B5E8DAD|nr:Calvin cycle protein CP12 [Calothrix sp. NIES-3974]BAZ04666.1 hypothetical protein NIES3974_13090 [Calothrix sp. NIES-3974]
MSTTLELINAQVDVVEEQMTALEAAILAAVNEARNTCKINGDASSSCAVAWDIVEELHAEKAHRQQNQKLKNNFEIYCDENPEADECRVYDV